MVILIPTSELCERKMNEMPPCGLGDCYSLYSKSYFTPQSCGIPFCRNRTLDQLYNIQDTEQTWHTLAKKFTKFPGILGQQIKRVFINFKKQDEPFLTEKNSLWVFYSLINCRHQLGFTKNHTKYFFSFKIVCCGLDSGYLASPLLTSALFTPWISDCGTFFRYFRVMTWISTLETRETNHWSVLKNWPGIRCDSQMCCENKQFTYFSIRYRILNCDGHNGWNQRKD